MGKFIDDMTNNKDTIKTNYKTDSQKFDLTKEEATQVDEYINSLDDIELTNLDPTVLNKLIGNQEKVITIMEPKISQDQDKQKIIDKLNKDTNDLKIILNILNSNKPETTTSETNVVDSGNQPEEEETENLNLNPNVNSDSSDQQQEEKTSNEVIETKTQDEPNPTNTRDRSTAGRGTGGTDPPSGTTPLPSAPPAGKIKEFEEQPRWLHLFIQDKKVDPNTSENYQPDFVITKSAADSTSQWVRRMHSSLKMTGGRKKRKKKSKKRKRKNKRKRSLKNKK